MPISCYITVLWFKNSNLLNYVSVVMFWTTFLQVGRIYRVRINMIYSSRLQLLHRRVNELQCFVYLQAVFALIPPNNDTLFGNFTRKYIP
jgi:hypothetical protein